MVGGGCWTVPAYQDPSFLQTAGAEQAPRHWHHPHPSRQEIPYRAEGEDHPAPASLPGRISPSHHLSGWGSSGIRVLLTHQGSICNRVRPHCSTAAGGSWRLPARAGGIWVRLAKHRDLLRRALAVGCGCGSRGHGDHPGEALREDVGVEEGRAGWATARTASTSSCVCVCVQVLGALFWRNILRGPGSDWTWEMSTWG